MESEIRNPQFAIKRKPLWRRWWVWSTLATIVAIVVIIGPWPTYSADGYAGTDYATASFKRLESLPLDATTGPLTAGVARADLTPPAGEPMAGYSDRSPNRSDGIADNVTATAISVSNGQRCMTIVGGEFLLFMPDLCQAVCQRAGVAMDDVYFTCSHTHSGPGGYGPKWIEQLVLGSYDQGIFSRMADAFADAIRRSRENMQPCVISAGQYFPRNDDDWRQYDTSRFSAKYPGHGTLSVIRLSLKGQPLRPLATMIVASPHPTCLDKTNRLISGDYPGVIRRLAEAETGAPCLFAAGSVGSNAPGGALRRGQEKCEDIGKKIWDRVKKVKPVNAKDQLTLVSTRLDVDLPPLQIRFSDDLRLSPVFTRYIHNRRSYIRVLELNEVVLLGMPSDYSGELTTRLEDWAKDRMKNDSTKLGTRARRLMPIVTSFNGDWVGYLVPEERYKINSLETRHESFCGPWGGEYFDDLSTKLLERLAK